ncbi:MAG: translation initiation factor IF-3 [Acidobacteriia bacterium]|nr:translation initiation factor IF-3 [Terriglobia bacterium]
MGRENQGGVSIYDKSIRINDRIRVPQIRVIDDEGQQLGVMPPFEALKLARERALDLVEISPQAQPPVCKIMDYGKYVYQLNKKAHEAKKHQKQIQLKEVKFRPQTDEHDYDFKRKHIIEFLKEGDKVKASVRFRGREMAHREIGRRLLERLVTDVAEVGVVEFHPKFEGPNLFLVLTPKKA